MPRARACANSRIAIRTFPLPDDLRALGAVTLDTLAADGRAYARGQAQPLPCPGCAGGSDPTAALAFLAQVADPDATHNCWAYRIGGEYRSSDDGEPAGTAGRPILAAIDGQGFDQVMVVVTRWYGGIKLGAGGLVRAYGGAAAECLRTAPRQPLVAMATLELQAGFDDIGAVHAALAQHGAEKLRRGIRRPMACGCSCRCRPIASMP